MLPRFVPPPIPAGEEEGECGDEIGYRRFFPDVRMSFSGLEQPTKTLTASARGELPRA